MNLKLASLANLFVSPHPDDLVYSAFAAITGHSGDADAVILFNVSRFTKWGLLPKNIVTVMRTVEETMILTRLGMRPSFLWMDDSSIRTKPVDRNELVLKLAHLRKPPRNLYCPLGMGQHPDHLAARDAAITYWLNCGSKPRICFYEDLPYAARISRLDLEFERCVRSLPRPRRQLSVHYEPLNADLLRKKAFFSRLYITQNDHTKLLERHGKELGRRCGSSYAERYVCLQ